MAYDIGPKIGIDGEAEFRRELNDIKTGIKTLGSEMKLVTATYDDNADSMEALAAKSDVLLKTYGEQEKYLEKTRTMLEEARKKYGENSSEVQKWKKAVYEAETELQKTANELKKTGKAMDDIGDEADDAGKAFEDLGEAAEKSSGKFDKFEVAAGNLISKGVSGLAGAVVDLGKQFLSLDKTTEEYRVAQGKLLTAFNAAEMGGAAAKETYTEFYKILGDTDTAAEASQLLAQLSEDQQDLSRWTKISAGVAGTFGDSLPIEGLIEAANETQRTGEVTGVLADALNWVGIQEDEFQAKLDACTTESQRNKLIMEMLEGAYSDAADTFYRNNEELVRTRENQAKLDEVTGELGESVSKLKNTFIEQFGPTLSDAALWLSDLTLEVTEVAGPALEGLGEMAQTIFDGLDLAWDKALKPAWTVVSQIMGDIYSASARAIDKVKEATGLSNRSGDFGGGSTGGSFGGYRTSESANTNGGGNSGAASVYLDGQRVGKVLGNAGRQNGAPGR